MIPELLERDYRKDQECHVGVLLGQHGCNVPDEHPEVFAIVKADPYHLAILGDLGPGEVRTVDGCNQFEAGIRLCS